MSLQNRVRATTLADDIVVRLGFVESRGRLLPRPSTADPTRS